MGVFPFLGHISGQIIATSHDLTPNGGLVREIPLFQGNLGSWNIIIWPDIWILRSCFSWFILLLLCQMTLVEASHVPLVPVAGKVPLFQTAFWWVSWREFQEWQWKIHHEWTMYFLLFRTWGFSNVILVFRGSNTFLSENKWTWKLEWRCVSFEGFSLQYICLPVGLKLCVVYSFIVVQLLGQVTLSLTCHYNTVPLGHTQSCISGSGKSILDLIYARLSFTFYPPPENYITWQWRIHHLKTYFLLNMVIFQCHVSFEMCTSSSLDGQNVRCWLKYLTTQATKTYQIAANTKVGP